MITKNNEHTTDANTLTSKQKRLAKVSENEIETNRIHRNVFHRPIVPSTLSTNKLVTPTKNNENSTELTTRTSPSNDTIVKQGENILPYTGVSHSEPKNEHVYEDLGILIKEDEEIDTHYDDADMDLIERDIRLFDNYSNISSSHQR